MPDSSIHDARRTYAPLRFPEDRQSGGSRRPDMLNVRAAHRDQMLRSGILVSESLTPSIEAALSDVCTNLGIPRSSTTAFVYNEPQIQADCLITGSATTVLRFSSGLINLMKLDELKFVMAHELGHFIFEHGAQSSDFRNDSMESFMARRAAELSADRIGIIGCGALKPAVRAAIKTASGLGDSFLRFDISAFLSQAAKLSDPAGGEASRNTHPSMLIRSRAMLWFSMKIKDQHDLERMNSQQIDKLNAKVLKDLSTFVDGQTRARKSDLFEELVLWKSAMLMLKGEAFDATMQHRFAKQLGAENLQGLKSFLQMHTRAEAQEQAKIRVEFTAKRMTDEFPSSFAEMNEQSLHRANEIVNPNN